jgi:flavin-dependent dehydrogenase
MQIKTVTIIGGGSSGWMTAAALSKLCPHVDVVLVESAKIGTVGVGESTLGHINKFFHILGLKDEDWMAACNATYKNSIRFTNFRENDGTYFEYPFSDGFDYTNKPAELQAWSELAALYPEEYTPDTFAQFYCTGNTFLAKYNKQTKNELGTLRNFDFKYDTAYHLDAQLLGKWLKEKIAIPHRTLHIVGDVRSCEKDPTGNITHITLTDGTVLKSDLWVDCTGFRSLLLEQWMGSEFKPFDEYLANDSAWACRVPYIDREDEMHNVTDCHALGNGWVWNIPLWNRIGTGYVYSSKFTTDEDAKREFREHLAKTDEKRAERAEMFHIKMRHGYRRRAWLFNVLGVGLSYGFVEPLESTGLLTTHENIVKLVDLLNRRAGYVSRAEREGFNLAVEREVLTFRDFVSMHYALSKRTDTPYWRWCTQINEYCPEQMDAFALNVALYPNLMGHITCNHRYYPEYRGSIFIAAGLGMRSIATRELVFHSRTMDAAQKQQEIADTKRAYEEYRDFVIAHIAKLPSHYEFLKSEIYGGKDEYASVKHL